jgi:hypothetical protein
MSLHRFTSDIRDPDTNLCFGNDIDFHVEAELTGIHNGKFIVDVTEVWLDGVEMVSSKSEVTHHIGCHIADVASQSQYIIDAVRRDLEADRQEQASRRVMA